MKTKKKEIYSNLINQNKINKAHINMMQALKNTLNTAYCVLIKSKLKLSIKIYYKK